MNEILHLLCLGLFLTLPPILLLLRFKNQKPSWWLVFVMISAFGWLSAFGSFMFYQAHIDDLIAQNQELPKGWDSDGASGLAVMFFGWLISLIYSLPWLIIFMLSVGVRKWGPKLQTD
tara:strand:- start:640 stop:993 length:354 start_codon:yes stop_codon:yes gene_type:complete